VDIKNTLGRKSNFTESPYYINIIYKKYQRILCN